MLVGAQGITQDQCARYRPDKRGFFASDNPEDRQHIVAQLFSARARCACQHAFQMSDAEALPGTIDR